MNETRKKASSYAIEEKQMDATACMQEAKEHLEMGLLWIQQAERHSAEATNINLETRREKVTA